MISHFNYRTSKTKHLWCSIAAYLTVMPRYNLQTSTTVCIIIWLHWLSFCLIVTWLYGKAESSYMLVWVALVNWNLYMSQNYAFCPLQISISTNIHAWCLTMLPYNISKWKYQSYNIKNLVNTYGLILSHCLLYPIFLLVSNALTIMIPFAAFFWNLHVSQINLGTFSGTHKFCCDGLFRSKMPGSSSTSDLLLST